MGHQEFTLVLLPIGWLLFKLWANTWPIHYIMAITLYSSGHHSWEIVGFRLETPYHQFDYWVCGPEGVLLPIGWLLSARGRSNEASQDLFITLWQEHCIVTSIAGNSQAFAFARRLWDHQFLWAIRRSLPFCCRLVDCFLSSESLLDLFITLHYDKGMV